MKQAKFELNRLTALSDGIFAIALTLLVLDLKLPENSLMLDGISADTSFAEALLAQGPQILSWILSFAILSRLWIVQHALLVGGGKRSRAFMGWTFVFLGAVSLVPFTTSLISERFDHALSVVVFSVDLAVAGFALDQMWRVQRKFFVQQSETDRSVSSPRGSFLLIMAIAVIASVVAIFSPSVGPFIWILYPLCEPIAGRMAGDRE